MKALAGLALAVACSGPVVVVRDTVTVPYIAVIPIENPDAVTYLGAVRCDLGNKPYVLISTQLSDSAMRWVAKHERVHLDQIQAYGSCNAFVQQFQVDTMFRLHAEADAYCAIVTAQRKAKVALDPDVEGVIWRLMNRYQASYTRDAVLKALPCG